MYVCVSSVSSERICNNKHTQREEKYKKFNKKIQSAHESAPLLQVSAHTHTCIKMYMHKKYMLYVYTLI